MQTEVLMIVNVDVDGNVSMTRDTGNFAKFCVAATPGVDIDGALQRGEAGHLPDEDARIRVDWLRAQAAGLSLPASWYQGLEGMLQYAASKGWLHDDGTISAHIEFEH